LPFDTGINECRRSLEDKSGSGHIEKIRREPMAKKAAAKKPAAKKPAAKKAGKKK
jgi:hypothetical protein